MFLKTCYSCGAKVKALHEGLCATCCKEEFKPIEDLKPIALKYCNVTHKIAYQNRYHEIEEFVTLLPNIVRKHIVISPLYTLKELEIEDLQIVGHKVIFDIKVECDLQ
ncbi:hypothetical protein H6501_02845 [Candidatus Woesearchaeota archaeon]|nr:hypothetical protein [Nanoarchaeota archaeon]MCB9370509.1 hypothetical protein [Candidatus Woesearchaeota archaeon]USN43587.1 MAG: hypothetical protein H6500_04290 [Candidatus Woesearchaeota archaeon]